MITHFVREVFVTLCVHETYQSIGQSLTKQAHVEGKAYVVSGELECEFAFFPLYLRTVVIGDVYWMSH